MSAPDVKSAGAKPTAPAQRPKADTPRRVDIQALRAFAVVAVLLFHVAPELFRGGFIGVDVFFVVSGYLVGGHLYREWLGGGIQFRAFFARRARRIVPVSALVATVTIIAVSLTASRLDLLLWGPRATTPTYTRDGIASVLGVSNLWFGVSDQGYLMDGYQSPYTQYWSLGIEEQFYVVAPVLLTLVLLRSRNRRLAVLLVTAGIVVSLDLAVYGATTLGVGPFFNPLTRAWELGAGLLLAMVGQRLLRVPALRRGGTALTSLGWCVLAATVILLSGTSTWPSLVTVAPVAASVLVLAVGIVRPAGRLAAWQPLQWIGDRSYSIYLWHWPILIVVVGTASATRSLASPTIVVLTLLCSWLSYRFVETPLRRLPVATRAAATRTLAICGVILLGSLAVIVAVGVHASAGTASTQLRAAPYRPVPPGTHGQAFATEVPLNLRPTLATASQDLPLADQDGCNVNPVGGAMGPADCIYGTNGPLVALFGDSHALQWLGALSPGIEQGRYRVAVVTANSCPPYGGVGFQYGAGCDTWQPAALTYMKSLSPDLVIVSASTWRHRDERHVEQGELESAMEGLRRDLAGLTVAWVADTPSHAFVPAECAATDVNYISRCTTSRAYGVDSPRTDIFRTVADNSGWTWIDMTDYLCSPTSCGVILGDVFLYRDRDHITNTLSTELAPVFEQSVLALLNEPE
ncbi:MAG: acyltransferase [Demequina sp.]|nr:acyltransferase [Demequina sp.]